MKKVILLVLVLVTILSANAQVFVENFANAVVGSDLEGYNNWKVSPKSSDNLGVSPKIGLGTLIYPNYASSNTTKVAILDSINGSSSSTQRISTHYATYGNDTMKVAVGEKLYVAFLAKFSMNSKTNAARDFFTFEASKTSSNTRGRLFAKIAKTGNFVLAVSKNSTTSTVMTESADSLNVNNTHLIVMVYEGVDGVENDKIYIYYNPDLSKTEIEQTRKIAIKTTETGQSDYTATTGLGFNLRQKGIGVQIGGIRAAKNWTDALLTPTGLDKDTYKTLPIKVLAKTIITENPGNICIYNLAGSEVLSATTEGRLETNLAKGMYLIKFVDNTGKTSALKVQLN